MPDEAKLAALAAAGYTVRRTCGTCVHAGWSGIGSTWGWCNITEYVHGKHRGKPLTMSKGARAASIRRDGFCSRYEQAPAAAADIAASGFTPFMEETP